MSAMYWWYGLIAVGAIAAMNSRRRDQAAKARFLAQYPSGVSKADLPHDVQARLQGGNRIRALKLFRKETGLGLKDAKEILDATTS
jgi:ribosomal protein L7/L12